MITYKNISYSAKTFYGVTFKPGETKSVPGYINVKGMVRIFGVKPNKKTVVFESPVVEVTRGRKKKANEPEKGVVAESQEIKITSEEENTNGNQS